MTFDPHAPDHAPPPPDPVPPWPSPPSSATDPARPRVTPYDPYAKPAPSCDPEGPEALEDRDAIGHPPSMATDDEHWAADYAEGAGDLDGVGEERGAAFDGDTYGGDTYGGGPSDFEDEDGEDWPEEEEPEASTDETGAGRPPALPPAASASAASPAPRPTPASASDGWDAGEGLEEGRMSLGDHIEELRIRLTRCIVVLGVLMILGLIFYQQLYDFLLLPLHRAATIMGKESVREIVDFMPGGFHKPLMTIVGYAWKCAVVLSTPVILSQLWAFVMPGLLPRERRAAAPVFLVGGLLFLTGVGLAFYYAAPTAIVFLIRFNQTLTGMGNLYTLDEYSAMLASLCWGFGICFELPLVMMAFAWTGLITSKGIARYWRHAFVGIFLLAAIMTPPDPVSQIALGTALLLLYALGYLLARWVEPPDDL